MVANPANPRTPALATRALAVGLLLSFFMVGSPVDAAALGNQHDEKRETTAHIAGEYCLFSPFTSTACHENTIVALPGQITGPMTVTITEYRTVICANGSGEREIVDQGVDLEWVDAFSAGSYSTRILTDANWAYTGLTFHGGVSFGAGHVDVSFSPNLSGVGLAAGAGAATKASFSFQGDHTIAPATSNTFSGSGLANVGEWQITRGDACDESSH